MPRTSSSGASLASRVTGLSPRRKRLLVQRLTDEEATALLYEWQGFWARPEQVAPWDYEGWLINTGRGWGKTRSGAEELRRGVEAGWIRRAGLVARTAGDFRDTLVEGEAGILAVSPPWFMPVWEPTKRKLTWPNGAVATTFSAEEPAALRGPSHDFVWADELACLVSGTLVETSRGSVPIEDVRRGDSVLTRGGQKIVLESWRSSSAAEVYEMKTGGSVLVGTADHPVWIVGRGFVRLSDVTLGDLILSRRGVKAWAAKRCIERSIVSFMGRSRLVLSSIIKTVIISITTPGTWSPFLKRSTREFITESVSSGGPLGRGGEAAESVELSGGRKSRGRFSVDHVRVSSTVRGHGRRFAPNDVEWLSTGSSGNAQLSKGRDDERRPTPRGLWTEFVQLVARKSIAYIGQILNVVDTTQSIEKKSALRAVYNITVDGPGEFVANRLLVHNSWKYSESWDNAMLGLRLGLSRWVATTTPKPVAVIKNLLRAAKNPEERIHVTTGNTYENLDNLSDVFKRRVLARYEGTRMGRQELHAEILEDNPDALWSRQWLEDGRRTEAPDMRALLVAVDPPGSSSEDAAEAGIVAGGVGVDDHGYLLEDASMHGKPNEWGTAAVTLYRKYRADYIVAEKNNGGEMVANTIHAVDPDVPVRLVWASRGKRTRAEPVSALYEQGRVHHVGYFPELEDQQCGWVPGEKGQDSPDRMDADVWLFTEAFKLEDPRYGRDYGISGGSVRE